MKLVAAILCLYLACLHVQPALFPVKMKQQKENCCAKKHGKHKTNDCCDGNSCNPFFSICQVCAANAIPVSQYTTSLRPAFFLQRPVFFSENRNGISQYEFDILHPPQSV